MKYSGKPPASETVLARAERLLRQAAEFELWRRPRDGKKLAADYTAAADELKLLQQEDAA